MSKRRLIVKAELDDGAPRHGLPGDDAESLGNAVIDVIKACIAAPVRHIPSHVANRMIAGCTLVALICPLLLWISWSKLGFFIVIGTSLVAIAIIYLLIWVYPEDPF